MTSFWFDVYIVNWSMAGGFILIERRLEQITHTNCLSAYNDVPIYSNICYYRDNLILYATILDLFLHVCFTISVRSH